MTYILVVEMVLWKITHF